jgi:signal transduction histidine kinase
MSRLSTRVRFILGSLLLLLPVLAVAALVVDQSFRRSQDQIVVNEFATADVVAQSISELIDGQQAALVALAGADAIRSIDKQPDQARMLMDDYRTSRPAINGVFLLKDGSNVVAQSGGIDIAGLPPGFKAAAEAALTGSQPTVSDSLLLEAAQIEVVAIIVPVYASPDSAAPSGAIGEFYSVERLIAGYQPTGGFANGSDIAIALISPSARVVSVPGTSTDPGKIFQDGPDLKNTMNVALGGQRSRTTFTDPTGLDRVTVAVPIALPGNDWAVLVSGPETTDFGPTESLIKRAVIAAAALVVLTIILAAILSGWLTSPFRQLASQARAISTGASAQYLEPTGPGDVTRLSQTIREMSDRLRAQVRDTESAREEIARQAERLRDLLRRTVRLQEDERRRIASDIHDAVSPLITGALYQAQAVRIAGANGNGHGTNGVSHDKDEDANDAQVGLKEVSDLLERAMRELHDVIFDLRPPDLDDIGIEAALQRHIDQVNRNGLPTTLNVTGEERRLSAEVRLAIYRIVQEALHNAVRHAQADEATVSIEWMPERLRVTIQDDGYGFESNGSGIRAGLGLMSMRERAASIGGAIEIVSRPGTGTAIIFERFRDVLDLSSDQANADLSESAEADDEPEGIIDGNVVDAGEEHVRL